MIRKILLAGSLLALSPAVLAQVPVEQLAKPPANATHYVIESTAGKHGDSWIWSAPDGTRMGRESMVLRGQLFELDSAGKTGRDGMPSSLVIRGFTPTGDAGETFTIRDGEASWKSPVDSGGAPYKSPAFYVALGGPIDMYAWGLERLLAAPDHTLNLLPGGKARAEKLTTTTVGEGAARKEVTAWAVIGISNAPVPIWADAENKFFGFVTSLIWLPAAYAGEHARLTELQTKALAARASALRKALLKAPAGAVAFKNVQVFDAEDKRFLADQTVVVESGRIGAVGGAASVIVPAAAQVIDGKGKTLVPGLWDAHMHVANDTTGVQELSIGVTSARDPGNDDKLTIERRERVARGELLMPNVYPSSLIDGKGPNTAQSANVATSEAEGIKLVDEAKSHAFTGVKFYGTLNPKWVPALAAEAHKLGLHVHGHIPQGMRPLEAVNDGYDEITHINWIVMQAMPDSVIGVDNGIARFEGPGRYAKDLDVDTNAGLNELVSVMAAKGIYSDPTMVAFESLYVPENGDLSPSYAAFVGTLPPATERGFRVGGFAVPKGLTRADYRASWAKMVQLLAKMHKAGVPIVAGTDGTGIELVRELEIYVEAGFTPAEALYTATLAPATLVGQQRSTGSITVGKVADLALIEGDPAKRVGDLRQTRVVMLGGKIMDADALRAAAGFSGRPR